MDFEHIVCRRGSKVRVTHDVPMWGLGSGRVKSFILNEIETQIEYIVLDEYVTMEAGKSYVLRFRRSNGENINK